MSHAQQEHHPSITLTVASPGGRNSWRVLKIDGRFLDSFVATDTLNSFMMACLVASVTHFLMPPSIFPETLARDTVISSEANLPVEKDAKKRVNHRVLEMSGPFAADWSLLRTLGKYMFFCFKAPDKQIPDPLYLSGYLS